MNKFEKAMDFVDELGFIKEKIDFMGEATAALALRTETGGLGECALCGLYHIYNELGKQCEAMRDALCNDFILIKKEPETPSEKAINDFSAAVKK